MTWIILVLNLATLAISLKKRVLPYFLFTCYFLFLVVGQAFQIKTDMQGRGSVSYLYAFMTREGFEQALWFLLGASILSLVLVSLAKGYTPGSMPRPVRSFEPPKFFYLFMLLFLLGLAGVLIFAVVGLSNFLNSSRPGFESGSTIFLTLLGFGLYPLLLKLLYRNRVHVGDLLCAAITLFVSLGFSRMHVILYVTALLTAIYYGKGWADRRIRVGAVIGCGVVALVGGFAFLTIGALRDAQNYTGGSIAELVAYNFSHPETNMLSLDVTYQRSVEGMSGLTGAFSLAEANPEMIIHDYGAGWLIQGFMLSLPSQLKARLNFLQEPTLHYQWYRESIIASGIEMSYTSFGWLGLVFYPLALFGFAWVFCLFLVRNLLTPPLALSGYMLLGCGIFFVRGTYPGWIGYSVAYTLTILAASPVWTLWIVPRPNYAGAPRLKQVTNPLTTGQAYPGTVLN